MDVIDVLMVAVLEVSAIVRNGRIDHNPSHPPFERKVVSVAVDVLEYLDKTVLQNILSILASIGVPNGGGKELAAELGIKFTLG